jgi:hypothetical protein
VEQEREKHEDDREYIPVPPTMALVQQAFNKTPNSASPEEHEAVRFFYKMCVATLDPTVTGDAMCGATVMQALDTKTERMQKEQDGVAGSKKKKKWENRPNTWAITMATAALFLDPASGASDTAGIVYNIVKPPGEPVKRTKRFKKKECAKRCDMYMTYMKYFVKIWLDNKTGQSTAAAERLAEWDKSTGMTREPRMSDAQKRSRQLPSNISGVDAESNKRSRQEGGPNSISTLLLLVSDEELTPPRFPPLTGQRGTGGGYGSANDDSSSASASSPSSSSNSLPSHQDNDDDLLQQQHCEVSARSTAL